MQDLHGSRDIQDDQEEEMTTKELLVRALTHVEDFRSAHPDEPLSPEMLTMEMMTISLESHMLINLKCERAIHEQIKILEGLKPS